MLKSIAVRLGQVGIVLVLVTLLTALLINLLPGDPAEVIIPFGSEAQRDVLRADIGLDDPLYEQYGRWLGDFLTGDFGNYYRQSIKDPVYDRVKANAPVSALLVLYAQALALLIAIPLGVFSAQRAGSRFDKIANTTMFGFLSVPSFVLAYILSYFVGVELGWFPAVGYTRLTAGLGDHLNSMVLPSISLALGQVAVYMRLLRTDLVATLQEDFVLMAKSKGIKPSRVMWRHALRPSSLTLLTVAGLNVGTLIGGALIIEIIFDIPGMGTLLFEAIQERQYVALQSLVAVVAIAYVLINVLVDVLYRILDPRIRNA